MKLGGHFDLPKKKEEIISVIQNKIGAAIKGNSLTLSYPGEKSFNVYFDRSSTNVRYYKSDVIAVLDDKTLLFDKDLLFTANGIIIVEHNGVKEICQYDSVEINKNADKLIIGSVDYRHNNIDAKDMYAAMVELKQISQKR